MTKETKNKRKKPKKKKSLYEKVGKINLDLMKLITSDEKFQNEIKKIRKKFGIPHNGFSNERMVKDFYIKLEKKTDQVLGSSDYNKKERDLFRKRKSFNNENNFQLKIKNFQRKNLPLVDFLETIKDIYLLFSLPKNFNRAIELFIIYNKILHVPATNFSIYSDLTKKEFGIIAYNRLTKEEGMTAIKQLNYKMANCKFRKARVFQEFHYPLASKTLKPYPNIDRDIKIENLSKQKGRKIDETLYYDGDIWKYGDKDITTEIWEDEDAKTDEEKRLTVRQARYRLKKARKKRFS